MRAFRPSGAAPPPGRAAPWRGAKPGPDLNPPASTCRLRASRPVLSSQPVIRHGFAYVLTLVLILTSLSFAAARGTNPDAGTEIVICSGVGMTTITIGPDGQPVEKTHICPDGATIFAADFALPGLERPESLLTAHLVMAVPLPVAARKVLSPSARGPPAPV